MDHLRSAAARTPEAPAVVGLPGEWKGEKPVWSYQELDGWADAVARALVASGIDPGERVAMRLPPCPEAVVLLHAVWRAGAILVPLNSAWSEAETLRGLAVVGRPSLLISTMGEVLEWDGEGPPDSIAPGVALPPFHPTGPAVLLLTSGSTGDPNPVALSHRNLAASAEGAKRRLALRPDDCWLAVLSPGHVGGIALLHRSAAVGSALFPRPRFDAEEAAALIDSGQVTHASLVPIMLRRLLEARGDRPPPATLRALLVGGAETPAPLLERALELGYPIALTYGLTEATSQVATAPPEEVRRKPGAVGRPLEGVEIRILGEEGDGSGEILVRGETVVHGLAKGASLQIDAEGWLHTGDLGRLDAEGDLWVVGRKSSRIVTGGVTVEPVEVEKAVLRHPGVREAAVVGVPDPEWGERILLLVVAEDPSAPPTLDALLEFTRERLAPAKRPRELRVVADLPRNANGKVDRRRLLGWPQEGP